MYKTRTHWRRHPLSFPALKDHTSTWIVEAKDGYLWVPGRQFRDIPSASEPLYPETSLLIRLYHGRSFTLIELFSHYIFYLMMLKTHNLKKK